MSVPMILIFISTIAAAATALAHIYIQLLTSILLLVFCATVRSFLCVFTQRHLLLLHTFAVRLPPSRLSNALFHAFMLASRDLTLILETLAHALGETAGSGSASPSAVVGNDD